MQKVELKIPTLIFAVGVAGSGKTTLMGEVIKNIYDAFLIDKDSINDPFLSTYNEDDSEIQKYETLLSGKADNRSNEHYYKHVRDQTYASMLRIAKDNLILGNHPILDAPHIKQIHRGYFDDIVFPFFEGIEHQIKFVLCYADEKIILQRLKKRGFERDIHKLDSDGWKKFLEEEPIIPDEIEKYDHIKINTTEPLKDCLRKTLDYIVSYSRGTE